MMPAHYREYGPHSALKAHVECFWTIHGDISAESPLLNRVLPDGCMDIIFDLSREESWVVGPMSRSLDVYLRDSVDLLGVRFRPGGLPSFIRHPAHPLRDTRVEVSAIWSSVTSPLQDALLEQPGVEARIGMVEAMLLRRLPAAPSPRVVRAVAAMQRSRGALEIGAIVDQLSVGRRQLERLFAEHVGLSPKQTARIIRFRQTVEALLESRCIHWAQFAVDCGFYDQAHLIREFRSLAGVTPEVFRVERSRALHVASVQSHSDPVS